MKALILAAGQGSRLLPLTADMPKCLLELGGGSLLEWQLRSLAQAGVTEAVVVTGFRSDLVETRLRDAPTPGIAVRTLYNPFYAVADNLGTCWIAREELDGPCLILNGDTLFEPAVAGRLLAAPAAEITVAIDRKASYDADDMKVQTAGDRLLGIGKNLPAGTPDGESIGFLRFSATGARRFVDEVQRAMRSDGVRQWYLSAIDRIAKASGVVRVVSIEGLAWSEMDFHDDLARCRALCRHWLGDAPVQPAAANGA